MRRFDAEYLRHTRRGMWADTRDALAELDLSSRAAILDVGSGSGGLTRILAEESPPRSTIVACDADRPLLENHPLDAARGPAIVVGDATRLPFAGDVVDLAICQALLINLSDPSEAVREFARVSSDIVAAVEPNNAEVTVASTVADESRLDRQAREHYIDGVETDVTLGGSGIERLFESVGIDGVTTRRYVHEKVIGPPYDDHALTDARRKATGAELARRRPTLIAGDLTVEEFDELRRAWRSVGRESVEQMRRGTYRRREQVPYYVTVGRVR